MEFIESPIFTKIVKDYLQEDEYAELQRSLEQKPDAGALIPGTGGFRKLRWKDQSRGKGRRGGLRIIYYHFASDNQIWFMTLYGKNEITDLSEREKRLLRNAIQSELAMRKSQHGKRSQG